MSVGNHGIFASMLTLAAIWWKRAQHPKMLGSWNWTLVSISWAVMVDIRGELWGSRKRQSIVDQPVQLPAFQFARRSVRSDSRLLAREFIFPAANKHK
jgi:hypothetical protein